MLSALRRSAALFLALLLAGSGVVRAGEKVLDELLSPGDPFYDSVLIIKAAQSQLSDDLLEQILIYNELADQLAAALEAEAEEEYVQELISDLAEAEARIGEIIEALLSLSGDGSSAGAEQGGEEPSVHPVPGGEDGDGDGSSGDDAAPGDEGDGEENAGDEKEAGDTGETGGGNGGEIIAPGDGLEEVLQRVISGQERRGWRLREKVNDESLPEHVRANAQKALDNQARAMEKAAWARESQGGPPPWARGKKKGGGSEESLQPEPPGEEGDSGDNGNGDEMGNGRAEDPAANGAGIEIQDKNSGAPELKLKGSPGRGQGPGRLQAPGQLKKTPW